MPHPRSATLTFLFTDLEQSTRMWQDHPDAMAVALGSHDELVGATIGAHGGTVFAHTGDGFAAAFERATEAALAAVAIQRALQSMDWPAAIGVVRARIGLNTGDAEVRDDNYFGPSLNRASRVMAVAWGGQTVCSATTAALLEGEVELHDLGMHRLRDLTRPEHVWQIGEGAFPPLRSVANLAGNLPLQVTEFIGRHPEVRAVTDAIASARIVTLTGVGGAGKTRLALQAAAELQSEFRHGTWVCELAPLTSSDAVLPLVARTVGADARPETGWTEAIIQSLRDRRLLLLLDNCEHVLDCAAPLAAAVARSCPDVVVLATSREGLAVPGERILAVGPLTVPTSAATSTEARASDAVSLFVSRARDVRPDLAEDDAAIAAIVQICRRLDGIPLAIELAAARCQALSPAEIVVHLDDRFRLLTRGSRSSLDRHQTLRAAIAWSFDLLDEDERTVQLRTSVFAGGFTLEAAAAVCGLASVSLVDVLDLVESLVRRSLVVAEIGETSTRYRQLETVRQFGAELLEVTGDADAANVAHLAWCTDFMRAAGAGLRSPDDADWVGRVERELDNIGAAVRFAISVGELESACTLLVAPPAGTLWITSLGTAMAALAVDVAAEVETLAHPVTVAVLCLQALDATLRSASTVALELAERACALARQCGDPARTAPWMAWALTSQLAEAGDDLFVAATEALKLATRAGDPFAVAEWHAELGFGHWRRGEYGLADELTKRGVELADEIGAANLIMRNRFLRGTALLAPGRDVADAVVELERATLVGARLGGNVVFAGAAWGILLALRGTSSLQRSASELRAQCEMVSSSGQPSGVRLWSAIAASLLVMADRLEDAAVLIGGARMPSINPGADNWQQTKERARQGLGDGRYEPLVERGAEMSLDQLSSFLLVSLGDLADVQQPA